MQIPSSGAILQYNQAMSYSKPTKPALDGGFGIGKNISGNTSNIQNPGLDFTGFNQPNNPINSGYYSGNTLTIFNQDGDRLDISYRSAADYKAFANANTSAYSSDVAKEKRMEMLKELEGCNTCKSRKYVDQSNDSSVSYQTPTNLNPQTAAVAIAAHEREHVTNEKARAMREDREIVNQSVSIQYAMCSECGTMYPAGGTTRTTSINKGNSQGPAYDNSANENSMNGET